MLSDKDIEKRMVEALEEGGRHTVDELVKSTGIDEKRIWRALETLTNEELCGSVTLEGTRRFYITAAHIKDDPPPKKQRKPRKVPDPVLCLKCGDLRSPAGMWKHVKYCTGKAKSIEEMVEAVDKVIDKETGAISTAHITVTPPADYTITAGPLAPIPMGVDAVLALAQTPNLFRILVPAKCTMDIIGWRIRFDEFGPVLESMEPESTLIIRSGK